MNDPVRDILGRLKGVKQTGPDQWQARCPAHEDRHPSLSIGRGEDGRALLDCKAGCSTMTVCRALGLPMRALFPPNRSREAPGRIVAAYDYRDAAGQLLYQVVRLDPKDFRQRRPDGSDGWTWDMNGMPRVLYRLPEVLSADPAQWIFVVEGEKDADSLVALGLIATTNPMGAGKWRMLSDDSALHGRRVAILPDKDDAGRAHAAAVAGALHDRAEAVRIVELPGEGKDVTDWIESLDSRTDDDLRQALLELAEGAPNWSLEDGAGPELRPTILIDTEEHRVVAETVAALGADSEIFQRGGILVRVLRDTQPKDGIARPAGSPTIQALPAANLRERMTRAVAFTKLNHKGKEVPAHPAPWLVSAVDARADWPGIRHLAGVSDAPVLRADGSVWQAVGYDRRTGVLFESDLEFPPVHAEAGIDHAAAALDELLEVVCDFQFESAEHRAAWLAGLLTPLGRFAYDGPSPLFLIDANVRGAGKGLLAQTVGRIVLGREMPASSYAHDTEEMRKRITAIAIAGDRMVLLDNLGSHFGNDALDRALTITRWKDRILGKSQEIDLPLIPVWYATGNNVSVAADTTRRIIHVRLDVLDEHPEQRTGFRHPNLLGWIGENRPRLLSAALTILSAYCRVGRPDQGLSPYGSFEGWSDLVRQAVVWVGLPDPCLTRTRLAESADTTADALSQLIAAWWQYCGANGVTASELLGALYPQRQELFPTDEASAAMRAALENIAGGPGGRPPTGRRVGNNLRRFRRRVLGGMYLDTDAYAGRKNGMVWRLYGTPGESGESSEGRLPPETVPGGESVASSESVSTLRAKKTGVGEINV